jgi:proline racemase/trans-L-3-hydroxyproline dehydratase
MARLSQVLSAIDTHSGGEPNRIITSGVPPLPGATMADKKAYMRAHLDHFRTLIVQEPRGHRDMLGAVLTPPVTARAHYGVLFLEGASYPDMCGHGIICIATALLETGTIPARAPESVLVFDTPAGTVEAHARIEGYRVVDVRLVNVPSFLHADGVRVHLPGGLDVEVAVAFGGNFFALARAEDLRVSICPENASRLIELGMALKKAVNEAIQVRHPTAPQIATVEMVEIYEAQAPGRHGVKNVVIFGEGQLDRSPCGTGTSAAMAMLHARGELPLGVELVSESILGTRFIGRLVRQTQVGEIPAVEPVIVGEAYLTGLHQLLVDPDDPFKFGFVLGR